MSRKALLILSLLTLVLASRCGFRFDNPVEHVLDASGPSGADASVTPPPEWFEPAWSRELIATPSLGGALSAAFGASGGLQVFGAHNDPAETCPAHSFAAEGASEWTLDLDFERSCLGPCVAVPGAPIPQCLVAGCGVELREKEAGAWRTFELVPCSSPPSGAAAARAGGVDLVINASGMLRHGWWAGDRTQKVEVVWEDVGPVAADAVLRLVVGAQAGPLVVVVSPAARELRYWRKNQTGWAEEVLPTKFDGSPFGPRFSPLVDRDGRLAYCWQEAGAALETITTRCTRWVADQWVDKTVVLNLADPSFRMEAAAMDSRGLFHVVTSDSSTNPGGLVGSTKYWREEGAGWNTTTFMSSASAAITLDAKDLVHVIASNDRTYHVIAPQ